MSDFRELCTVTHQDLPRERDWGSPIPENDPGMSFGFKWLGHEGPPTHQDSQGGSSDLRENTIPLRGPLGASGMSKMCSEAAKPVVSEGMSSTRIQMLGGPRTGGGAGEPETQRRAPIECLSRALD